MTEVYGIFNTALCYTDILEDKAAEQILSVCNRREFADSKIRIMPDVHAGMGCTIGTTMTITDKIVPGMVGVDIGCGMETVKLKDKNIDFDALDALIRKRIPSGRNVRDSIHPLNSKIDLTQLRCAPFVDLERARHSIGTLGGGNHFIEINCDDEGDYYLVIHSGSRHLGNEVAKYYQKLAVKQLHGIKSYELHRIVEQYRAAGRECEIDSAIKKMQAERASAIPKELAYVYGEGFDSYIHDMKIMQHFAALNRKAMVDTILSGLSLTAAEQFTTIHNYIDTENMILRKGAVSARKGEMLLIPINMRDGSLICRGLGNEEWNCSAPHGAGRLMSRADAKRKLSIDEYKAEMEGIYTTCVGFDTIDEAPMAYKSMESIVSQITPTAEIIKRIVPVYNFKASE